MSIKSNFLILLSAGTALTVITANLSFLPSKINGKPPTCRGCNMVVIDVDILRSDALDCNKAYSRTPNICGFAERSVYFKQNSSLSDMTLPSFVSFESSLYPTSHGIWNELYSLDKVRYKLLGEILKENGYTTAFMGLYKYHNKISIKGYDDAYEVPYIFHPDFKPTELVQNLEQGQKPFLLYLYIADLHFPYLPAGVGKLDNPYAAPEGAPQNRDEFDEAHADYISENYKTIFTNEAIKKNSELFSDAANNKYKIYWLFIQYSSDREMLAKYIKNAWKPTEETYMKYIDIKNPLHVNYLKGNYLAILNLVDEKLAPLLDLIRTNPRLSENTIVVLRSDHGEEFGEHRMFQHGNNLYQELTQTPLIVYAPGISPKTVDKLTQDIDVMPTLLDLTGITVPQQSQGTSLISLLQNPDSDFRNYQIAQKGDYEYVGAYREGDWKLIMKEGNPIELYNLKDDSGEKNNLLYSQRSFTTWLFDKYETHVNKLPKLRTEQPQFPEYLDDAKRKRLKEEGYF